MSNNAKEQEMALLAEALRSDNDWAHQERGVYTKEVMERELEELLPVKVGLKAIEQLRQKQQK